MENKTKESVDSKIVIAPSLASMMEGIDRKGPYLDFYGKNIETNQKNEKVASAIRTDVLRLISFFEKNFFQKWQVGLEDYTLSNLRRQLRLESKQRKNAANVKAPIIRTFVDRLRKGISKANFSIKANALTKEYKDRVDKVQNAIERAYSTSGARNALLEAVFSALLN